VQEIEHGKAAAKPTEGTQRNGAAHIDEVQNACTRTETRHSENCLSGSKATE
jgi:hypothetical protein